MFDFEIVCEEFIYNVCDDFYDYEFSKKDIAEIAIFTINELQTLETYHTSDEFSIYYDENIDRHSEAGENFFTNLTLFIDTLNVIAEDIYNYYHNEKNTCCPWYWQNLMSLIWTLSDVYKTLLWK